VDECYRLDHTGLPSRIEGVDPLTLFLRHIGPPIVVAAEHGTPTFPLAFLFLL
jgi:hypothetical protein